MEVEIPMHTTTQLGVDLLHRPDIWCKVANRLPLGARAACSRLSRSWKELVEGDGLHYGVATLCSALAGPGGKERVLQRIGAVVRDREAAGEPEGSTIREVQSFLQDEDGEFTSPETWLKVALLDSNLPWLREGALKTRIAFDGTLCELGWTRLHLKVAEGDAAGVRDLVGQDREARTSHGCTALHFAADFGRLECLHELLVGGCDKDAENKQAWRAAHLATRHGHIECVRELLSWGAEREARTSGGATPLHIAAEYGHVELVRELSAAGADFGGSAHPVGATPLHLAAYFGQADCVRELLARGADVEATTRRGSNALHLASQNGHAQVVAALIEGRGNVDAATPHAHTSLHIACENAHPEVVGLLLAAGADKEAQTLDGRTPLLLASQRMIVPGPEGPRVAEHAECVRVLAEAGAKTNPTHGQVLPHPWE